MSVQYYLYSAEDFPAKLKPTRSFAATPEWLQFNGFTLYDVKAHSWIPIEPIRRRTEYEHYQDHYGRKILLEDSEIAESMNMMFNHPESPYFQRGLMVVDRETYEDEAKRKEVVDQCEKDNLEFRARVISEYEAGLQERMVTGTGRGASTPYEEECYKILGMTKPNSVDAIMAQRNPGAAFAKDIVAAINEASLQKAQIAKNVKLAPGEEELINAQIAADEKTEGTTRVVLSGE